jgi:hypothetical protein
MDAIATRNFLSTIDVSLSESLQLINTHLHTLENLLKIKKKYAPVDRLYFKYINNITELYYMFKNGKLPHKTSARRMVKRTSTINTHSDSSDESGQSDSQPDSQSDQTDNTHATNELEKLKEKLLPAESTKNLTLADSLDAADAQLDLHISTQRKLLEESNRNPPKLKNPIKWLTDTPDEVEPRVTANIERVSVALDDAGEFEVIEEKPATNSDIINSLIVPPLSKIPVIQSEPGGTPIESQTTGRPKTLSQITAEALGVNFKTPDEEPATVNALFKIGPRHREILKTKLYLKAKSNITALNPDPSLFDELCRAEADRLLSEWIANH